MILAAFRRSRGHTLGAVPPEHDRLAAALTEWEKVKNLPDDADEKLYAAVVLEKATAAAEAARLEHERPRNPDGTFASSDFGNGVRGARRTFQPASAQESSSQLLVRSLTQAAGAYGAVKAAKEQARKDVVELEQTRSQAERAHAEASEHARAAGEKEPRRTQVAAHDKRTDEAKHELKVAELTVNRALAALENCIEEFGHAWLEQLAEEANELQSEWQASVNKLIPLHSRLSAVAAIRHQLGVTNVGVRACGFMQAQIGGLDFAASPRSAFNKEKPKGWVQTPDVLAPLHELPNPPAPEPEQDESANVGTERVDGSPTQGELEELARHWDARHAR